MYNTWFVFYEQSCDDSVKIDGAYQHIPSKRALQLTYNFTLSSVTMSCSCCLACRGRVPTLMARGVWGWSSPGEWSGGGSLSRAFSSSSSSSNDSLAICCRADSDISMATALFSEPCSPAAVPSFGFKAPPSTLSITCDGFGLRVDLELDSFLLEANRSECFRKLSCVVLEETRGLSFEELFFLVLSLAEQMIS